MSFGFIDDIWGLNGDGGNVGVTPETGYVFFDGINDYLERDGNFTGLVDSYNFTFSAFFKGFFPGHDDSWQMFLSAQALSYFYIGKSAANTIACYITSATGGSVYFESITPITVSSGWTHILISFDGRNPKKIQLLVNGVDDYNPASLSDSWPVGGDKINFGPISNWRLGSHTGGIYPFSGFLAEPFFNISDDFFDISVNSNMRKFLKPDNTPNFLGINGQLPLGISPTMFCSTPYSTQSVADFIVNKGTGGGMNQIGLLEIANIGKIVLGT